ncbi:hypothetical protein AX15_007833 [Amanita polypyramis BW_CC]|nr:hypothetical protein AX15_007833 [Amanita polypyramis BW_CC]
MYERAAGDKTLPSDLRPPHVLKRTLDYLFHDLLPREGFSTTFNFIRDRTRAVRNDFTMQHQTGSLAIECHDRCARFHILALHLERNSRTFSIALEEQQLMNTLQSLKEFYEDQRGRYQSATELEMRVYHRLIHIRDQRERPESIPEFVTSHPVFKLTTAFRLHVQKKSAPISKNSALIVDEEGMQIFAELASVLREQGNVVMIYLVACILERLFGPDMIEGIEEIRGDLSIPDIIDGIQVFGGTDEAETSMETDDEEHPPESTSASSTVPISDSAATQAAFNDVKPVQSGFFGAVPGANAKPTVKSAFSSITSSSNVFGTSHVFGGTAFGGAASMSGTSKPSSSLFGGSRKASISVSPDIYFPCNQIIKLVKATPLDSSKLRVGVTESNSTAVDAVQEPTQPSAGAASPPVTNEVTTNAITLLNSIPPGLGSRTTEPSKSFTPPSGLNPTAPTLEPLPLTPTTQPQSMPPQSKLPSTTPVFADTSSSIATNPPVVQPTVRQRQLSMTSTRRPSIALPKINTDFDTNDISPSSGRPPPLAKIQPISLPSTPAATPLLNNSGSGYFRSNLSISNSRSDILSPLPLSTSGLGLVQNFSPVPSPSEHALGRKIDRQPTISIIGKGKGKEVENGVQALTPEEMRIKALAFAQKGFLVKQYFETWKQRVARHAAWLEACRHSDTYRQKIRGHRQARGEITEKKRRRSTGLTAASDDSPKKRIRKRISMDYQSPRTDEELAQRLKENYEVHAHRWARGSFLQALMSHVGEKTRTIPSSWQIWLSTNPDSDATAIWMERKFDVPDSGHWVSDTIFSIPISQGRDALKGFPGVIVFELTPVQNVKDDIERKYHILDDCARLRDIVKALPSKRHYIPSLLVIHWGDASEFLDNSDFSEMVRKLVDDSVIGNMCIFSVTTEATDLDIKFKDALSNLRLDTSGKLVQSLSVQGLFKRFESALDSFISEWLENSVIDNEFDWTVYGELVKDVIRIISDLMGSVSSLLNVKLPDALPPFDSKAVDYGDTAYESAYTWLSEFPGNQFAEGVIQALQSHQEAHQEFPPSLFLKHIFGIAVHLTEVHMGKHIQTKYFVMRTDIAAALNNLKIAIQSHQTSLSRALNRRLRRSPKRRGMSEETEESISVVAKRRRLSASVESPALWDAETVPPSPLLNGRPSPSPSVSTISLAHGDQPPVTVAMLRALTKNLKKKYVSNGSS